MTEPQFWLIVAAVFVAGAMLGGSFGAFLTAVVVVGTRKRQDASYHPHGKWN